MTRFERLKPPAALISSQRGLPSSRVQACRVMHTPGRKPLPAQHRARPPSGPPRSALRRFYPVRVPLGEGPIQDRRILSTTQHDEQRGRSGNSRSAFKSQCDKWLEKLDFVVKFTWTTVHDESQSLIWSGVATPTPLGCSVMRPGITAVRTTSTTPRVAEAPTPRHGRVGSCRSASTSVIVK